MTAQPIHARDTIMPTSINDEEIAQLAQFLAASPDGVEREIPFLLSPEGERHEIPVRLYDALKLIVDTLADGCGVTVVPTNAQLTTQKAADFLHVSRPTLVKLLESGEIPFTKVGRHRRVLLADLTAYEARIAASRDEFLTRQTREAAQKDEYFAMPDDHETR